MNKGTLIRQLSTPLLLLGILLVASAYVPLLRRAIGTDTEFALAFSTTLLLLIAGFMASLAGLISLYRESARHPIDYQQHTITRWQRCLPHLLGLTLLIPIPLINCLLIYITWLTQRKRSQRLDQEYRTALNFQISIQLYWLLILFLMPIGIGFLLLMLLFLLHFVSTVYVLAQRLRGQSAHYPASIKIVATDEIPGAQR